MSPEIVCRIRGLSLLKAPDSIFYYRNDPNDRAVRYKWIGISSRSFAQPLRSAAEQRLMPSGSEVQAEINNSLTTNCVELAGKTLVTTDHWLAGNMCHMLFDHFYRHWLATKVQLTVDHCLVIGEAWGWMRFVAEELLGIRNIMYIKPGVAYHCQELYFWSNSFPEDKSLPPKDRALRHPANRADQEYLHFLRQNFIRFSTFTGHAEQRDHASRLFISRKAGSLRSFKNLTAIEEYFRLNGFDVEYLEDHTPSDQIRLMRNRSHVAGLHGAGLTNLIAVDQKTKILEIFGNQGTDAYFKIMKALGNKYLKVDNRGQTNPLVLDMALLEKATSSYLEGNHYRLPRIIIEGLGHDQAAEMVARLRRSGYRSKFRKSCNRLRREEILHSNSSPCHVLFVRRPQGHWQQKACWVARQLGYIIPAFDRMLFKYRNKHILNRLRRSGYTI